eukprot:m.143011 g.143011  ORF g.143011 m.143011 type:complete len:323 (+) comp52633_c2_seq1:2901-3869(+)
MQKSRRSGLWMKLSQQPLQHHQPGQTPRNLAVCSSKMTSATAFRRREVPRGKHWPMVAKWLRSITATRTCCWQMFRTSECRRRSSLFQKRWYHQSWKQCTTGRKVGTWARPKPWRARGLSSTGLRCQPESSLDTSRMTWSPWTSWDPLPLRRRISARRQSRKYSLITGSECLEHQSGCCPTTASASPHPQGDGVVERMNGTLQGMLAKVTNELKNDWDLHLSAMCHAHNTSLVAAIETTPFEAMLGRSAPTLVDQILKPGDLVLVHDPVVPPGQSKKFQLPRRSKDTSPQHGAHQDGPGDAPKPALRQGPQLLGPVSRSPGP